MWKLKYWDDAPVEDTDEAAWAREDAKQTPKVLARQRLAMAAVEADMAPLVKDKPLPRAMRVRLEQILDVLKVQRAQTPPQGLTVNEIIAFLGVSRSTVVKMVNNLLQEKRIVLSGRRPAPGQRGAPTHVYFFNDGTLLGGEPTGKP